MVYLNVIFKKDLYLFIWNAELEREREICHPFFTPRCLKQPGLSRDKVRSPRLSPGLLSGWPGSNFLSHHLLPPRTLAGNQNWEWARMQTQTLLCGILESQMTTEPLGQMPILGWLFLKEGCAITSDYEGQGPLSRGENQSVVSWYQVSEGRGTCLVSVWDAEKGATMRIGNWPGILAR